MLSVHEIGIKMQLAYFHESLTHWIWNSRYRVKLIHANSAMSCIGAVVNNMMQIKERCFSHSTVSELYYEVHITRILRTARISNVDGVMYVDRKIREMVGFELSKEKKKDVFRLVTSIMSDSIRSLNIPPKQPPGHFNFWRLFRSIANFFVKRKISDSDFLEDLKTTPYQKI